jgi:uncharacterized protein YjbI with pentapeptide repeats/formylglycine-generating enzyme required for sulfatase activity
MFRFQKAATVNCFAARLALVLILVLSVAVQHIHSAPITVPVGNAGNPPDQNYAGQGQFGAVPYGYRIAIHEVTNAEYALFLNFKVSISYDPFAPFPSPRFSDPRALLHESMLYDARGGLTAVVPNGCLFNCNPGGPPPPPQPPPHFEARLNQGDKPVKFVSWYDALRYVNWLNNGQSFGSTETGAYTLGPLGAAGIPIDPNAITRNPGATWVLPNEDEWYKAAYYQPEADGGDSDGYWLSPTRSNVTSATLATANSTGNISNPGANVMNESGASWYGLTGNVTTVGSAGPLSASYYGTFDQGGNVQEWLESMGPGGRIVRGGSWDGDNNIGFRADQRTILTATYESADVGFRVAQLVLIVPEPATFALAALGILGIATRRARRNVAERTFDRDPALPDARNQYIDSLCSSGVKRLIYVHLVGLLSACASPVRADIFQWEYINPADPSQGKRQSTTLCVGGTGLNALPNALYWNIDLNMAYLIGADLTNVRVGFTNLINADLSQANLTNAFVETVVNLSGANFRQANLTGASIAYSGLTNADLTQANLTNVQFSYDTLTDAKFTDAEVRGAKFRSDSHSSGISLDQLYSTASYKARDLTGLGIDGQSLAGANLAGQTLSNASFFASVLSNVDLTGAEVRGAIFGRGWSNEGTGLTPGQLYSTASYTAHDLSGIGLTGNNLAGADLTFQNLTNAAFYTATLTGANLSHADLTNVNGISANFSGANLSDANLTNTTFYSATFANTRLIRASLSGAILQDTTLINADFNGAILTNANLSWSTATGANLSGADARGASFLSTDLTVANTSNLIRSNGHIAGLNLTAGASLVVRDYDGNPAANPPSGLLPIVVDQHMAMDATGALRIVFEADAWDSTISFAPGIPVALGGTLELMFADDVNPASQLGRTFDLFDWTGVNPTGAFSISSPYIWDLSNLYTTGQITLTAIPEPASVALVALVLLGLVVHLRWPLPNR